MKRYLTLALALLFYGSVLPPLPVHSADVKIKGSNAYLGDNNALGNLKEVFDGSYNRTPKLADIIAKDGPWVDVRAFGTALTHVPVQAAIDNATAGDTITLPRATYVFGSQVNVNKAVTIILMGTKVTSPSTGYAFHVSNNDAHIECRGDAMITATAGGSGVIWNDQALRAHYWNLKINENNVQNQKIFFHDGGWYTNVKNLHIDKANHDNTTASVYIKSTYTGVIGATGSWGGAYVGTYENLVADNVVLSGASNNQVTTMTFTNLDASHVTATNALSITLIQPVIQSSGAGNKLISLDNVYGWNAFGGDFEGSGTVYTLTGNCGSIFSIGNNAATAFSGTYKTGTVAALGVFHDYHADSMFTEAITGAAGFTNPLSVIGNFMLRGVSLPQYLVQNTGYTNKGRFGIHYDGDTVHISQNCNKISGTQVNLDDTTKYGTVISLGASTMKFEYAASGANPRNLTTMMYLEYNQSTIGGDIILPNLPSSAAGGSKKLYYNAADNTVKYAP